MSDPLAVIREALEEGEREATQPLDSMLAVPSQLQDRGERMLRRVRRTLAALAELEAGVWLTREEAECIRTAIQIGEKSQPAIALLDARLLRKEQL